MIWLEPRVGVAVDEALRGVGGGDELAGPPHAGRATEMARRVVKAERVFIFVAS